jgi:hypothetical protein
MFSENEILLFGLGGTFTQPAPFRDVAAVQRQWPVRVQTVWKRVDLIE